MGQINEFTSREGMLILDAIKSPDADLFDRLEPSKKFRAKFEENLVSVKKALGIS